MPYRRPRGALEVSNPPTADDLERIAERVPDLRGYPLRAELLPGRSYGRRSGSRSPQETPDFRRVRRDTPTRRSSSRVPASEIRRSRPCPSRAGSRPERARCGYARLHEGPAPCIPTVSAFGSEIADRDARWLWRRALSGLEVVAAGRGDARRSRPTAPARPVPQRLLTRTSCSRRTPDRRLGVLGHGRPVLRPRQLLDQPRPDRGRRLHLRGHALRRVRERDFARVRLLRIMSDFREAMWGIVQQGATTDADYVAYAGRPTARARLRRRSELDRAPCRLTGATGVGGFA